MLFLAGFWLQFHTTDFFTYGGYAYYVHVFQRVADILMYAGTALGVLAIALWMYQGIRAAVPAAPVQATEQGHPPTALLKTSR
jgi:uncharacterized membrane protein